MKTAVALVLSLLVVACGGTSSASPGTASPSATPTASASPGASPSPSASPNPAPSTPPAPSASPSLPVAAAIDIDSIARVVTGGLRVRSQPRVADDSALLTPLLNTGRTVFVVAGPVVASGYTWYRVQPIRSAQDVSGELPFGWVASADKDGTPWLVGGGFTCPARPTTFAAFTAVPALVGLACFGRANLSFATRLADPEATCGVSIGWDIDPSWLASTCPQPPYLLEDPKATTGDSLYAVVDPSVHTAAIHPGPEPADWIRVTVTGHFDHRAAQTCRGVSDTEPVPMSKAEIVLTCRSQFVITAIKRS